MKLSYATPLFQISLISKDDLIRTSGEEPLEQILRFAKGDLGQRENLADFSPEQ